MYNNQNKLRKSYVTLESSKLWIMESKSSLHDILNDILEGNCSKMWHHNLQHNLNVVLSPFINIQNLVCLTEAQVACNGSPDILQSAYSAALSVDFLTDKIQSNEIRVCMVKNNGTRLIYMQLCNPPNKRQSSYLHCR